MCKGEKRDIENLKTKVITDMIADQGLPFREKIFSKIHEIIFAY